MLASLLRSFPDVFPYGSEEPERNGLVQHEIDTGDHHPLRQLARRTPVHYQSQLNTMVQDMLNKVIRPSTSPYASPSYWLKTRTGDYASGYWQVEVRPADRQKKVFIISSGLYEFETMPFGLANAPAISQRLMQAVLQDLVSSQCLIYLDDIIVHAPTIDEHNSRLKNVFERLRMAGLKLKLKECVLLKQEVSLLGHLIIPTVVKTGGTKLKQIVDWPVPRLVSEARSFMKLAWYYREFVSHFAEIAFPLHQLTEKGKKFVWSAECYAAFNTLKDMLSSPLILGFPDFSPSAGP
ncbi:uncharacterized protein DEA37_0004833 [Paragonimus westermani]|uniref:Reverse transcriptase domain-containing protein n=1 Tax=Paragonimus westermani TaxID=34504 RepID=A0A5J4NVQ2_9TREM|nr:uncharacterized protein DEA37_0004833 [Paragonimus westermani]